MKWSVIKRKIHVPGMCIFQWNKIFAVSEPGTKYAMAVQYSHNIILGDFGRGILVGLCARGFPMS